MRLTSVALTDVMSIVSSASFKEELAKNISSISSILDRTLQKYKMVNVLGWDKEVVDDMERDYIRYLALVKTLQDFNIDIKLVPNLYIDEFWHNHILDTEQYYEDCYKIFGKVLHHFPYYGMLGEDDRDDWLYNSSILQEIWKECFGEELYTDIESDEDGYRMHKEFYGRLSQEYKRGAASRCRTTCKPQNCP